MARIIITQPDSVGAPHIHEVHLLHDEGRHAFAGFNVTEKDGGRTLHVSSFLARDGSQPPGVHWFRDFAAKYFPRGEVVEGFRLGEDGKLTPWSYRFRLASPPVFDPRWHLVSPEVWGWAVLGLLIGAGAFGVAWLLSWGLTSLIDAALAVRWGSKL